MENYSTNHKNFLILIIMIMVQTINFLKYMYSISHKKFPDSTNYIYIYIMAFKSNILLPLNIKIFIIFQFKQMI